MASLKVTGLTAVSVGGQKLHQSELVPLIIFLVSYKYFSTATFPSSRHSVFSSSSSFLIWSLLLHVSKCSSVVVLYIYIYVKT